MMPALRCTSFGFRGNQDFQHIAAGRRVEKYRSGRLALAHALKQSDVGPGCDVLVPAYHCQSIVEPIEAIGGRAVFYRVLADLLPDLGDVERKLSSSTKSVIAVHFFGVEADLSSLRVLCGQVGATLIEDCAHCFSYSEMNPGYGLTGDFVITSPRKFLPIFDGGELFSPGRSLAHTRLRPFGARYQLKIVTNTIERAWAVRSQTKQTFVSLLPGNPTDALDGIGDTGTKPDFEPIIDYCDPRFDYTYTSSCQSLSGQALTRLLSLRRVSQLRKRNYRKLEIASQSFRFARKFVSSLERSSTPYVFPILIDDAGDMHSQLKRNDVPMWRWEDMRPSDCGVSKDYSKRLIQLPCHQELTKRELDQMIKTLLRVLT